jgi:AcrR family transcriptional regulator
MKTKTKRVRKKPVLVRGEPVVRGVLAAALRELARVGYRALRIEDVAEIAGVNKTTIYRRWPTKEDLVQAALLSIAGDKLTAPDTGSLRGDLLEVARCIVTVGQSLEGKSLVRVMVAEGPDSELMAIARSLRATHETIPRSVFDSAVARGELASTAGTMLLIDVLKATVHHRIFFERAKADAKFLRQLVDLILHGALAGGKGAPRKTAPVARRRR